ncbi:MAG: hypothetical protein Kow00127_20920 [Bacteroidales bacterium]
MADLKLLVVDDEPGIRSGIDRILRNFSVGYPFMEEDFTFAVHHAETGEEALQKLRAGDFDIVLLDNKLPGIQGVEVLEWMGKEMPDVAVMMITSYASLDLAIKATDYGAYNFVPKPFTPQELKAAVEAITKHLVLKRMTRKMQEDGQPLKQQFLSVLSHELKSPINAVEGYLQIMKEEQAGDRITDYQPMIDRCLERLKGMRTLIHDLLNLTRVSAQGTRHLSNIDLTEIARGGRDLNEPMARQTGVRINPVEGDECWIEADRADIEMIVNNLISNAVKYNRPQGEVNIRTWREGESAFLEVSDTGIGMTAEEQKLLFQDFVRIRNSKTKSIPGSGLGLSIVKKLVSFYSGDILVESQPDKGSRFTVKLPVINRSSNK